MSGTDSPSPPRFVLAPSGTSPLAFPKSHSPAAKLPAQVLSPNEIILSGYPFQVGCQGKPKGRQQIWRVPACVDKPECTITWARDPQEESAGVHRGLSISVCKDGRHTQTGLLQKPLGPMLGEIPRVVSLVASYTNSVDEINPLYTLEWRKPQLLQELAHPQYG